MAREEGAYSFESIAFGWLILFGFSIIQAEHGTKKSILFQMNVHPCAQYTTKNIVVEASCPWSHF